MNVFSKDGKVLHSLRKFNMKRIDKSKRLIYLGSSGSGKTWLIRETMYKLRDIPEGVCISGTKAGRNTYKSYIPDSFIYKTYEKSTVINFIKNQEAKMNKGTPNPEAFLIMDDLLFEKKKWVKSPEIAYIFMNSRNDRILYLLSLQYPIGIGPELRTNSDYIFIAREKNINCRKKIYENYAGMFPTFKDFCTTMDQITEDFRFLVIDNQAKSNNLEDQVFWYKAKERTNFRVGSEHYWSFHNKRYDDEYLDGFSD